MDLTWWSLSPAHLTTLPSPSPFKCSPGNGLCISRACGSALSQPTFSLLLRGLPDPHVHWTAIPPGPRNGELRRLWIHRGTGQLHRTTPLLPTSSWPRNCPGGSLQTETGKPTPGSCVTSNPTERAAAEWTQCKRNGPGFRVFVSGVHQRPFLSQDLVGDQLVFIYWKPLLLIVSSLCSFIPEILSTAIGRHCSRYYTEQWTKQTQISARRGLTF